MSVASALGKNPRAADALVAERCGSSLSRILIAKFALEFLPRWCCSAECRGFPPSDQIAGALRCDMTPHYALRCVDSPVSVA